MPICPRITSAMVALFMVSAAALPSPASGQRLQYAERMLELIGEGDVEAYARFRSEAFADTDTPEQEWRSVFGQLHEAFGRLEILDVSASPRQARLVTRPSRMPEAIVIFEFRFEPQAPHRILEVGVAVEEAGPEARAEALGISVPTIRADMTPDALEAALETYLSELAGREILSGTVMLAQGGARVFRRAYGQASRSYAVANTVDTAFRIGSITKVLMRVAAADLMREGRLRADATVAELLPDFPGRDADRIEVRHLLDHSSGLAELRFEDFLRSPNRVIRRPRDYFALFADDPLQFEPGSEQRYSNAGYIVLGAIFEAVTGEPYERALARRVFEPAGMIRSGFWALDRVHPALATGYWKCQGPDGPWCSNDHFIEIEGTPSGGSYSTADDLFVFQRALAAGDLLPAEWTHWVYTGEWPGEGTVPDPARWQPMWAGGAEGVSAVLAARGEFTVVVLSNHDEPAGELIGLAILQALAGAR